MIEIISHDSVRHLTNKVLHSSFQSTMLFTVQNTDRILILICHYEIQYVIFIQDHTIQSN
jgi:hypothetical protein